MSSPNTQAAQWPKAYLLSILSAAVKQGHLYIQPISAPKAKSLAQSLYRVRRRSDTSQAAYILPEYHLVTCGAWEQQGPDPLLGRLSIMYSSLPDGETLPDIVAAETSQALPQFQLPEPQPQVLSQDPLTLSSLSSIELPEDFDISSFVNKMKAASQEDS